MNQVNWGIIGCGDVTEIKSGPAFNKVNNSSLVAVMRRDADKAKDYAKRHNVPKWYSDASLLINDPNVNAIYVATPPSSHEEYTLAALKAGKPVYVEKPMSLDSSSASIMTKAAEKNNNKLVVAHYRRAQPLYKRIKQLLQEKAIGETRFARIELYKKPMTAEEMADPGRAWRVDTAIAGGGLFNDLSPHQFDMMYYFFGEVDSASGLSTTQVHAYNADDIVGGTILFKNGVLFDGLWCFNVAPDLEKDQCEIIGSEGKISFSFFEHKPILLTRNGKTETISFDPLPHVQQPMIEQVVNYFLNQSPNPCPGEDGVTVMELIDRFTKKN
ncbi:MAG: Gfo/Idh/MocA family oxidoreductase [Chitinophagaceae bacterium]